MTLRVETVLPEPWIRGMDVTEILAQGNFGNLYIRRGSWPFTIARGSPLMASGFTAIGGAGIAGTAFGNYRQDGVYWWRGVSGTQWINGRYLEDYQFPIGQDLTVEPQSGWSPMQYCWEGIVNIPVIPAAGTPFHFGIFAENTVFTISAQPGVCLVVDPAVSANWRVYSRPRAGGATGTTDTGLAATAPIYARMIYQNTSNPSLAVEVNGVQVFNAVGLANVPQLPNASVINWKLGFVQGNIASSAPGKEFFVRQCRIWAEELPGYV